MLFMHDTPQSLGFTNPESPSAKVVSGDVKKPDSADFNRAQKAVLRNPPYGVLLLPRRSCTSRAMPSTPGVWFYLEAQKGYSTLDASLIISISSVCGIVGTVASGLISDRMFNGSRNVPALVFGLMNVAALCLFLLVPGGHFWLDATAMVLFGLGIGVLIYVSSEA